VGRIEDNGTMRRNPLPAARVARSRALPIAFLTGAAALALAACSDQPAPDTAHAAPPAQAAPAAATDPVARGEYLVKVMVCNDCHTPWKMGEMGPEPDMSRMLSGHPEGMALEMPTVSEGWMAAIAPTFTAFGGPFGVSYAANLTPDATGLGAVTEEMFTKALRNGKHYGEGRPILPPMPWMWYRNLTDEDMHAMWTYLQSIPPIQNTVPQPIIPEMPSEM
jgi:hypothetical protein